MWRKIRESFLFFIAGIALFVYGAVKFFDLCLVPHMSKISFTGKFPFMLYGGSQPANDPAIGQ